MTRSWGTVEDLEQLRPSDHACWTFAGARPTGAARRLEWLSYERRVDDMVAVNPIIGVCAFDRDALDQDALDLYSQAQFDAVLRGTTAVGLAKIDASCWNTLFGD